MARAKRHTLMANPTRRVEVYYDREDAKANNAGTGFLVPWATRPNSLIPINEPFLVLNSKRKGVQHGGSAIKILTSSGRIAWINYLYVTELVIVCKIA